MNEIKSFWDRNEGYTGMAFLGVFLLGGGYILYKWLPAIIKLLENTLYAGFLFGIVAFVVFLIANERTRTLGSYMFQSICRKITSIFTAVDPIGILKNYIRELKDNMTDMDEQIQNLRGQMGQLKNTIQKNEKAKTVALQKASASKGNPKYIQQFTLEMNQAGRLHEANLTYLELYKKMEMLYQLLTKARTASDTLLQDMEGEVNIQIQKYEMTRTAHKALKKAMSILKGDGASRELYDGAMEFVENQYGQKMGEITHLMEVSQSFMDGVDLQNAAFQQKAVQMLDEWEKSGGTLLGQDKQSLLSDIIQSTSMELVPIPAEWAQK